MAQASGIESDCSSLSRQATVLHTPRCLFSHANRDHTSQKSLRFVVCVHRADDDSVVWRGETGWHAVGIRVFAMSGPLVRRVEVLEEEVNLLSELPGRVAAVETQVAALRAEMRDEFAAVRSELRAEIRSGDEETRRYMRVLHEDVISRIALLQEGMDRSNGKNG